MNEAGAVEQGQSVKAQRVCLFMRVFQIDYVSWSRLGGFLAHFAADSFGFHPPLFAITGAQC